MNISMQKKVLLDEEKQIIQRAVSGEKQAFGLLYDKYANTIFRYILIRLGNREDAEDMTESVFIKAWESLDAFNWNSGVSNFRAWVYRIAHNSLVDAYRKRKQELPLDGISELPDDTPQPEDYLDQSESVERISKAIKQLDEKSMQVILNRFFIEMDNRESAEVMGLSEGHVRIIQFRALKKLKQLMGYENE